MMHVSFGFTTLILLYNRKRQHSHIKILCVYFHFLLLLEIYICVKRERERERERERVGHCRDARTERWRCGFSVKLLCLFVSFCLVYITFRMPTRFSLSNFRPTRCTLTRHLQACKPCNLCSMFTSFRMGTCILFTLRDRCTYCCFSASSVRPSQHAIHAIYLTFPLRHLRPVYLRNRCITCYDIRAIYVACQRDLQVNIQQY